MDSVEKRFAKEKMDDLIAASDIETKLMAVIAACDRVSKDGAGYLSVLDCNMFNLFSLEVHRMIARKRMEFGRKHDMARKRCRVVQGREGDVLREIKTLVPESVIVNGRKVG